MIKLIKLFEIKAVNRLEMTGKILDDDDDTTVIDVHVPVLGTAIPASYSKDNPNEIIFDFLDKEEYGSDEDEILRAKFIKLLDAQKIPHEDVGGLFLSIPKSMVKFED